MIPIETILSRLPETEEERRDLFVRRLKGEDTLPVGSPWLEEDPADLVVPLLGDGAPSEVRSIALVAWRQVYQSIFDWVAFRPHNGQDKEAEHLGRLCRTVEIGKPLELRGAVHTLLSATLDNPFEDQEAVYEIFSAWQSYEPTTGDLELVEILIRKERFAAAAFNRLLELNVSDVEISQRLFNLWVKKYEEGWKTDAVFLALGLEARRAGLVQRVLERIRNDRRDLIELVKKDLSQYRRDGEEWAINWTNLLREEDPLDPWLFPIEQMDEVDVSVLNLSIPNLAKENPRKVRCIYDPGFELVKLTESGIREKVEPRGDIRDFRTEHNLSGIIRKDSGPGSFENWNPMSNLIKREKGAGFWLTISLESGRPYRFRDLLDDASWDVDWESDAFVSNEFSTEGYTQVLKSHP
jgi:hypothetical protein